MRYNPLNNATFASGTVSVTIDATASDSDGTVTQVEFFSNALSINVDATAPYSATLTNPADGVYNLTAVATDDAGATTTPVPVQIVVGSAVEITATIPAAAEAGPVDGEVRIERKGDLTGSLTVKFSINTVSSTATAGADFKMSAGSRSI